MRALNQTRDQIKDFISTPLIRYVSLDFNAADSPKAQGIEVVMPDDATNDELAAAQLYCYLLQWFYASNGIQRIVRKGRGRKEGEQIDGLVFDAGHPGVIHTEPFFAADIAARRCIERNHFEYCSMVLVPSFGNLDNVTFILPHTQRDPGATTKNGKTERGFASHFLMDNLIELSGEITEQFVYAEVEDEPRLPQVTFEEVLV